MEKGPAHTTTKGNASTITDPVVVALMEELTLRFGSKEEAMKVFALFSAIPKETPAEAVPVVPPPLPMTEKTTTQPSSSQTEDPQTSVGDHVHDRLHAETGEQEGGDLAGEKTSEGETPVSESFEGETLGNLEGKTPGFEFAVEEIPKNSEEEIPFVYVEGGTLFVFPEGETLEKSVGEEILIETGV